MEPIRVLHVFGNLDAGVAESRTMDIYRQIDKSRVQFDFLIHTEKKCFFEEEINEMGGRIFRVPRFGLRTFFSYRRELNDFFEKHPDYKIVHGHILSTAFIYQKIAKKHGVVVRIAHSRCGSSTRINNAYELIKELLTKLSRFYVTDKFAVSNIAGISAFGERSVLNCEVKVLPNAIKTQKYLYNHEDRIKLRSEFSISNRFVVGHIGRFEDQKNHDFIIDIFSEVNKQIPNSVLILVGDGELKASIEDKVNKLRLSDNVIFTGVRADVPEILQAMDVLLFPSFFEGLPGVVLEAQAAGLPCIISDKITDEVKITDLVEYVSLDKTTEDWAEKVMRFSKGFDRRNTYDEIVEAGYDIESVAIWYQGFYLQHIDENYIIRVLHIVGTMNRGGQETFLMNVYRAIDRERIQFDFIVHSQEHGDYEDEIEGLGGRIFRVTRKEKSILRNFYDIKRVVKDNQYKIVQRHSNNSFVVWDLLASKLGGAKMLIAHSHSSNSQSPITHKICRPILKLIATHRYACSSKAGKWLYGEADFKIINNGIASTEYIYSPESCKEVRQELDLENKFVIGHVGRLTKAKNHLFLLDIFSIIRKTVENAVLILVGDGELREEIEKKISELELQDSVKLLGVRSDVPRLLQAMDVFLFPSLYEGLPVSVVEAQASGLPCVISDTITDEVVLTNLVSRCSLGDSAEQWAQIVSQYTEIFDRHSDIDSIINAGFDISFTAKQLQQYYLE
ncbi:MAG: glycosyltransferase family 1 protein [Clostridium sp.]